MQNEQDPNHDRHLTSCPPKSTQLSFELIDLLVLLAYVSLAYHSDQDGHAFVGLWGMTDRAWLGGKRLVLKRSSFSSPY